MSSKNNKIGLVSFFKDPNYGTLLQAFALAFVIKKLGRNCEYVNYVGYKKKDRFAIWLRSLVKNFLVNLGVIRSDYEFQFFYTPKFRETKKAMDAFYKKHIPYSKVHYTDTLIDANAQYSSFMVGSDQTWSPFMTKVYSEQLFLKFVDGCKAKSAYAPSIGTTHIKDEYKEVLRANLTSFAYVSCRERENAALLTQLINRNVEYVCDPTLLVTREEWMSLAESVKGMPERFVLCYILGEKDCIADFAEKLGKEKGIPVYFIITRPKYLEKKNALGGVSPEQFISLISKASYVVTDSFHGTIFSINLGVSFYSFTKRENKDALSNDNDRISLFLKELGLENRFREDGDMLISDDIDYKDSYELLHPLRERSEKYLAKIIG